MALLERQASGNLRKLNTWEVEKLRRDLMCKLREVQDIACALTALSCEVAADLWHCEKTARIALDRLTNKLTREDGPVDSTNFEIDEILLKPTHRPGPPYGWYCRRAPWRTGVLESNARRICLIISL